MQTRFAGNAADYGTLPISPAAGELLAASRINTLHGMVVPNVEAWRAGDVVLSKAEGASSMLIAEYQGFLYPYSEAAEWTHVGLYDGDGIIWDANPQAHVQARHVADYLMSKTEIAIVRPQAVAFDSRQITEQVAVMSRSRYNLPPMALFLLERVFKGVGVQRPEDVPPEDVICSTLIERVYRHCGHEPFPHLKVVLPADYAASTKFLRVELGWCRTS